MHCQCGMTFKTIAAEAQHRHCFPALCKLPKPKPPAKPIKPPKERFVKVSTKFLDEVSELLSIAYYASCKMGLQDKGDCCSYAHEVRMLAWHFSEAEKDVEPPRTMTTGGGTYRSLRNKMSALREAAK